MFDWITAFVQKTGYLGVGLLMFAENVFPPIPSELIMPLAGFTAAQGRLSIVLVVISGGAGSLLGATAWYYIGIWLGLERLKRFAAHHGRWLTMSPDEIEGARLWFDRHGSAAVLVGRLVPGIRTLISVPAGIAPMPLGRFLIYSSAGTGIWTAFLAGSGYLLESRYDRVAAYADPVSNIVVGLIVLLYLYRVPRGRTRTYDSARVTSGGRIDRSGTAHGRSDVRSSRSGQQPESTRQGRAPLDPAAWMLQAWATCQATVLDRTQFVKLIPPLGGPQGKFAETVGL
jgi:membrane protein DedA with SNARE-associated domain